MLKQILNRITNNFGLKILAVVIAVIAWLVIVNVEDPEKTKQFTVAVELINQEVLDEQEKTYEVLNNTDVITFTVTGQRSYIERLTVNDFTATADLADLENNSQVPITIKADRYGNYITITKRSLYVEIFVEDVVTEYIPVKIQTEGAMPEGFQLAEMQPSKEKVRVTGPESVVGSIQEAVAVVNVADMQKDSSVTTALTLYDFENEEVDTSRLSVGDTSITITVGVLEGKTVPLVYSVSGTPSIGWQVASVSPAVEEIEILGKPDLVAAVTEIQVQGEQISVEAESGEVEKTIDLLEFLPEGISLADNRYETVTVTITMEQITSEVFAVPVGNIELINVPEGYEAELVNNIVEVVIQGYPSELNEITATGLEGTIDMSGVDEGKHRVAVALKGNYRIEGNVMAEVFVKKEAQESETEQENSGSENNTDAGAGTESGSETQAQ